MLYFLQHENIVLKQEWYFLVVNFEMHKHIENIDHSLPDRMNITIKRAALADPISKLF